MAPTSRTVIHCPDGEREFEREREREKEISRECERDSTNNLH